MEVLYIASLVIAGQMGNTSLLGAHPQTIAQYTERIVYISLHDMPDRLHTCMLLIFRDIIYSEAGYSWLGAPGVQHGRRHSTAALQPDHKPLQTTKRSWHALVVIALLHAAARITGSDGRIAGVRPSRLAGACCRCNFRLLEGGRPFAPVFQAVAVLFIWLQLSQVPGQFSSAASTPLPVLTNCNLAPLRQLCQASVSGDVSESVALLSRSNLTERSDTVME
jgi:hypothetical protein